MPPGRRESLQPEPEVVEDEVAENAENVRRTKSAGGKKHKQHERPTRPVKRARTTVDGASVNTGQLAKLQAKYDALRSLRETEVEKLYAVHKAESQARDAASADFIKQLQNENARLKKELADAKAMGEHPGQKVENSKHAMDSDVRQLESHLEAAIARVNALNSEADCYSLISQLTNTTVREIDGGSAEKKQYVLTVASTREPQLKTCFEINVAANDANREIECTWTPSSGLPSNTSTAIRAKLPKALTDGAICFEPRELPKFFKALWSVMKDLRSQDL